MIGKTMTKGVIKANCLSKKYKIYAQPLDRILEWLSPSGKPRHREFWALRNISFQIERGDAVGIIGANGAGKSTLLKIISGTARPTEGQVHVAGRIAALLELGMGFHGEFTGRQNIRLNGKLLGLSDEELDRRMPDIIAFSELGDFIEQPLRTYSSGMYVRLGFSVAASVDPDILIVDEALSVGDVHFQQKCIRRIQEFHEKGTTLLFVSHDPGAVKALCGHAILLDEGLIVSQGRPDDILDHYNALLAAKSARNASFHMERTATGNHGAGVCHSGNFLALITDAGLQNSRGEPVSLITAGQPVRIFVRVFFLGDVDKPTVGFVIKDRLGNEVFGTNTYMLGEDIGPCASGETLEAVFTFDLNIGCGEFTLTAAAHTLDMHVYECYDWADRIFSFQVAPSADFRFVGMSKCYPQLACRREKASREEAQKLLEEIFQDAGSRLEMGSEYGKYLCRGWYQPETGEGGLLRWTDREFSFFLRTRGTRLLLTLACPRPDIERTTLSGTISGNGVKIADFKLNRPDPETLIFDIPSQIRDKLVLFKVILGESWRPGDYSDCGDFRDLGVVVQSIRME